MQCCTYRLIFSKAQTLRKFLWRVVCVGKRILLKRNRKRKYPIKMCVYTNDLSTRWQQRANYGERQD